MSAPRPTALLLDTAEAIMSGLWGGCNSGDWQNFPGNCNDDNLDSNMILKAHTWQLWRQDDNGQRFLVGTFATLATAEAIMAELMRGHHKQTYWVSEQAETEQ